MSLRLAFMGTPEFSAPTLKALNASGHDVVAVFSQPPRPAGRGKKLQKSPIHTLAEEMGLPVFTPSSLRKKEAQEEFIALNLDVAIVVAYGLILPQAILSAPKHGCINIHASLLPRWRGAAPIHRAIMAGDKKSGITIMQMDKGLDTGDMLSITETPINATTNTQELHDTLSKMGAEMILKTLQDLEAGRLNPQVQSEIGVCYAEKIDKAEAQINWQLSAVEIDRKIRGLFPFPGAWFSKQGERIKILKGHPKDQMGEAGTVLDNSLTIACGTGAYQIERAQRAGKAPMDVKELLRGLSIPAGESLDKA